MTRVPIIVAVSGSGRSLENLINIQEQHRYAVVGVITSNPKCRGFKVAGKHHIPVFSASFDQGIYNETAKKAYQFVEHCKAELIILAGFIKKFPIRPQWERRVLNIHPSLLPKHGGKGMYGMAVHKAVLDSQDEESGATVHFVNDFYDEGQVYKQIRVPVDPEDTPKTLGDRVFEAELSLYPEAIDQLIGESP